MEYNFFLSFFRKTRGCYLLILISYQANVQNFKVGLESFRHLVGHIEARGGIKLSLNKNHIVLMFSRTKKPVRSKLCMLYKRK